jgi:hypothetical protein
MLMCELTLPFCQCATEIRFNNVNACAWALQLVGNAGIGVCMANGVDEVMLCAGQGTLL